MDEFKKITFTAPVAVKRAFRRAVIDQGTDMTAVLVALMTSYAAKHGEKLSDES